MATVKGPSLLNHAHCPRSPGQPSPHTHCSAPGRASGPPLLCTLAQPVLWSLPQLTHFCLRHPWTLASPWGAVLPDPTATTSLQPQPRANPSASLPSPPVSASPPHVPRQVSSTLCIATCTPSLPSLLLALRLPALEAVGSGAIIPLFIVPKTGMVHQHGLLKDDLPSSTLHLGQGGHALRWRCTDGGSLGLTFTQSSLVPPALGVPQHVFWALVDVPQGEFAEQLVPTEQRDQVCRDSSQQGFRLVAVSWTHPWTVYRGRCTMRLGHRAFKGSRSNSTLKLGGEPLTQADCSLLMFTGKVGMAASLTAPR